MRVLIAPQEFKGSLSADEAAAAIAEGIRRIRPDWHLDILPLADGGPGFIDALRRAVRADTQALVVHDALGRRVLGRYIVIRGSNDAVVEAAQANGLWHIRPEERDALNADSFGVGELIAAAAADEPARMIVGVGGSATTDGGAGMARALGARFLSGDGRELPPGGAALANLERIDWSVPPGMRDLEVIVATDVTNPLLGPLGAAAVYAPQKGASPADVDALDAALTRYAAVVRRSLGVDVSARPGGGAAGGLAAGLVAFLGARIVSGFDVVADATALRARMEAADLVITGEGSFDAQSLHGKTTGRVLALAEECGKPCTVFAGRSDAPSAKVHTLTALEPDPKRSMAHAHDLLATLSERWARDRADTESRP